MLARLVGIIDPGTSSGCSPAITLAVWALEIAFEYASRCCGATWRRRPARPAARRRIDHVQDLDLAFYEEREHGGADVGAQRRRQPARALPGRAAPTSSCSWRPPSWCIGRVLLRDRRPRSPGWRFLPMPFIVWGSLRFQRPHGAALRGGARAGRAAERAARQQPRRHRDDQELHRRGARGASGVAARSRGVPRRATATRSRCPRRSSPLIRMAIVVGLHGHARLRRPPGARGRR